MAYACGCVYAGEIKIVLCDADHKPVLFAEIGHRNRKKLNPICAFFQFGVQFWFSFGVYVKALIGFKAFYFFSLQYILEMALREKQRCLCVVVTTIMLC